MLNQADDSDPPRLLALRSELGYVDRLALAMLDEPEAVSEPAQIEITRRSQREWKEARRRRWDEARKSIDGALDSFAATINGDPPLCNALKAVRRSTEAVTRRL